jgi:hypothetical protein
VLPDEFEQIKVKADLFIRTRDGITDKRTCNGIRICSRHTTNSVSEAWHTHVDKRATFRGHLMLTMVERTEQAVAVQKGYQVAGQSALPIKPGDIHIKIRPICSLAMMTRTAGRYPA